MIDAGPGMPAHQLAAANRRLAGHESFTVAPSKYLGHYVAGHLADRHGIDLRLEPRAGTGITAVVDLPASLLVATAAPTLPASPASVPPASPMPARVPERVPAVATAGAPAAGRGGGPAVAAAPPPAPDEVPDLRRSGPGGAPGPHSAEDVHEFIANLAAGIRQGQAQARRHRPD